MAAWSPPRPKAISKAWRAEASLWAKVGSPRPTPMERVTGTLPSVWILRMSSRILNRPSTIFSRCRSSVTMRNLSPSYRLIKLVVMELIKSSRVESMAPKIRDFSLSLACCMTSP